MTILLTAIACFLIGATFGHEYAFRSKRVVFSGPSEITWIEHAGPNIILHRRNVTGEYVSVNGGEWTEALEYSGQIQQQRVW